LFETLLFHPLFLQKWLSLVCLRSEIDPSVTECFTFSQQLRTVSDVMNWSIPSDIDILSAARVSAEASNKKAYTFLDSVNKLICLYLLEFPMEKVCQQSIIFPLPQILTRWFPQCAIVIRQLLHVRHHRWCAMVTRNGCMQVSGKSMDHIQSLGKQGSNLCSAQWAFVLETHPSLPKKKFCPLCTVPAKVKTLDGYNPAWDMFTYNFSTADTAKLLKGIQGLTTEKIALTGLKLPQGVKRKLT
jgi:hypothetical protein